jgi:urea transporter
MFKRVDWIARISLFTDVIAVLTAWITILIKSMIAAVDAFTSPINATMVCCTVEAKE